DCYEQVVANYTMQMESLHVADAIESIMVLARRANKYVDETAPWVLAKDEATLPRLKTVLYNLIECIRGIAVMITPIMPTTAEKIFSQINCSEKSLSSIRDYGNNSITKVSTAEPLFERIDEAKKIEEINKAIELKYPAAPEPETLVSFDDFQKVSMRVMEVVECENIKKSDKLYKLMLNDGVANRQVVSGIAKFYSKEELIGKKVIVVSNLKPVKLCGVESNGMILAGDCDEKIKVVFVDSSIANGTKLR
ncbi:MAG: methionine--tRNA ligase subunit beta, partial [Oscillospiraceae bacterium]